MRRRTRTLLTLVGVSVGIMALTVLGAMAERMQIMARGSMSLLAERITIVPDRTGVGTGLILPDQVRRMKELPGVAEVHLRVEFPYTGSQGSLLASPMVHGVEPTTVSSIPLRSGRHLQPDDRSVAVAGAGLAAAESWRVGDEVIIHDHSFTLVGIVQSLMSVSDHWLFVTVQDARRLMIDSTPLLSTLLGTHIESAPTELGMDLDLLATSTEVSWASGTDPEQLSRDLQRALSELTVISPGTMRQRLERQTSLMRSLVTGSALIGLLIGGVFVANTMVTAVSERRSEIALKRALGASRDIVLEVLAESATMGLLSGLCGVGGGTLVATVLNIFGAATHTPVFAVTGRLIAVALAFSLALGTLSGLGPAIQSARLSPVDGLRHE